MYKDWVDKAIYVRMYHGRLTAQKLLIEKKLAVLQKMAEDLIEEGVFNFQEQRIFPMGRQHFGIMVKGLAQIVNKEFEQLQPIFSSNREKISEMMKNGKRNIEFG